MVQVRQLTTSEIAAALIENEELDSKSHPVVDYNVTYELVVLKDENSLHYSCTCRMSISTGFPFAPLVRVAGVFDGTRANSPAITRILISSISVESFFRPYWRVDQNGWPADDIQAQRILIDQDWRRRNGLGSDMGMVLASVIDDIGNDGVVARESVGDDAHEEAEEAVRRIRRDREKHASWAGTASHCNEMHRLATNSGAGKVQEMMSFLRYGLEELRNFRSLALG